MAYASIGTHETLQKIHEKSRRGQDFAYGRSWVVFSGICIFSFFDLFGPRGDATFQSSASKGCSSAMPIAKPIKLYAIHKNFIFLHVLFRVWCLFACRVWCWSFLPSEGAVAVNVAVVAAPLLLLLLLLVFSVFGLWCALSVFRFSCRWCRCFSCRCCCR